MINYKTNLFTLIRRAKFQTGQKRLHPQQKRNARLAVWRLGLFLKVVVCFSFFVSDSTGQQTTNKSVVAEVPPISPKSEKTFAIAIHGGAGSSPSRFSDQANERRLASMKRALEIGTKILKDGGTALDAVEQVIRHLEDDPQFNSGKGAVFNAQGKFELDASIMDGKNKACGAVAGVKTIKNPISLARLVMTRTRHVLLASDGAETFADGFKSIERVENDYFATERSRRAWQRQQQNRRDKSKTPDQPTIRLPNNPTSSSLMGTVGCVALDSSGNLAAGTSTGGMTNKKFGRVGDSPIVGAGTYADNNTCAVSCTGIGEQFIRNAVAYNVSARMRFLKSPVDNAVNDVLNKDLEPGDGGIIAVDHQGNISMRFSTNGMARAAADSTGRFEVIWGDKKLTESKSTPKIQDQ